MKKVPTPKQKLLVSVVLLLLVAAVAIGGTVAIYTSQVFQRSVVRNRDTEAIRFSSDKLYRIPSSNGELAAQKYYYPMSQGQQTMSFTVCNYDQSKNTVFSEKDIGYTVAFAITNGTDGFDYSISHGLTAKTVQNGGTVSFTNTLTRAKKSSHSYTITFNKGNGTIENPGDYNRIEVAVTVTPTDLTLTKNTVLKAALIPIEYATTQGLTAKHDFTDSTRGGPDQFDAYNLSVSISGGEGDMVISWDASKLDIDPFFVSKSGGESGTADNGYATLTVHMNSEDATGAYLIQFYNHTSTKPAWQTWDEVPIKVELVKASSTE